MVFRITVLMSVFNCEETLAEALDSLFNQTYKEFKLVLCDDCSTDNTFTVAKEYANKYDNIILLRNEENIKLAASLNRCLEYADTEYVARMDGDDISLPHRFKTQIEFLDSHHEYSVVSSAMIHFDEKGDWGKGKVNPMPDSNSFKRGTPHPHAPSMLRTHIMKEVGGYTVSSYLERGQDYYLWYKIYKKGYQGYNFIEPLYKMRDDQNAISRRTFMNRYKKFIIEAKVLKSLNINYPILNAMPQLIKGFIPVRLMRGLRKTRLN